jgi:mercuric ion binding protein
MKIFAIIFGVVVIALSLCCSLGYAAEKTVTLSVPGMTCAVCPITVKKSLTNVNGVDKVDVNFEHKTATVIFDDQITNVKALTNATKDVGYPSSLQNKQNIIKD